MSEVFTPQELVYLGALLLDLVEGCPNHAKPIRDSLKAKLKAGVPIEEYKPFGVPINAEFYKAKGTINGESAYSNGHILLLGEFPWADAKETVMQKLWDRATTAANAEIWPRLLFQVDDIGPGPSHSPMVLFTDGSTYNLRYYDYLAARFPSARYFRASDETLRKRRSAGAQVFFDRPGGLGWRAWPAVRQRPQDTLVVHNEGQPVALLQPLRYDGMEQLAQWVATR